MYYLRKSLKLIKYEGKPLGFGSPGTKNYTNALSLVLQEEDLIGTIRIGTIDPIGTIRMEKGWAYGPILSPRIRAYPRTIC